MRFEIDNFEAFEFIFYQISLLEKQYIKTLHYFDNIACI